MNPVYVGLNGGRKSVTRVGFAGGGWLSFDEEGRIVAVEVPGIGTGSFEILRDALAQADANLERRREDEND